MWLSPPPDRIPLLQRELPAERIPVRRTGVVASWEEKGEPLLVEGEYEVGAIPVITEW